MIVTVAVTFYDGDRRVLDTFHLMTILTHWCALRSDNNRFVGRRGATSKRIKMKLVRYRE